MNTHAIPQAFGRTSRQALIRRFYALSVMDRYFWKERPSLSPRFKEKQEISEALLHLDGLTHVRPPEPEPSIETHDLESFLKASNRYRRPVILRGFASKMKAVQRWDESYLLNAVKGVEAAVCVQDAEAKKRSWDVPVDVIDLDLGDYIKRMKTEDLYLNNSSEVLNKAPSLKDDLDLDTLRAFGEPGSQWDEFMTHQVFISGPNVFSSLHAAIGGNFFLQITGRKKWTLIDPKYAPHVHAIPARPFQAFFSAYGGSHSQAIQGKGEDHILNRLLRYEFTLEPGDLLYNAPWWMHEVSNLDPVNVGCAIRHITPPYRVPATYTNVPAYGLTSLFPVAYGASIAHWVAHKLLGYKAPFRSWVDGVHHRMLRKLREKN